MAESIGVTLLRESSWCPIQGLTQAQARALETLGEELSATDSETGETTSLIHCRFTTSGIWEVRVADAIGLVGVDSESWPVDPKIPSEHLFYLLQRGHVLPSTSTKGAEMASGNSFWHLLYDWFLRSTETLLRADLAKGYTPETRELPYIRGTVDTLGLSRGLLRGHTRVRCRYEEFSADIPINRIVKSALLFGLGSGTLQSEAARRTRRLLARFADVGMSSPGDLRTAIDRHTSRYRDPLLLALHILRGRQRELSVGTTRAWCFLWRTPDAVEAGIREVLRAGLIEVTTVTKEPKYYTPLRFTPDLRFGNEAIGDVKYTLDEGKWVRDDVYQLLAFAVAHQCSRALLVNFHTSTPQEASVQVAETHLKRLCWQLDRSPEQAGELLVEQVKSWPVFGAVNAAGAVSAVTQ
jgi:5-methylcytosine-specific restriction endonuclease McrBC regulatory subunit McrC